MEVESRLTIPAPASDGILHDFYDCTAAELTSHSVERFDHDMSSGDAAHANLLVENTESNDFLSSGRTTENLHTTLETIDHVLTYPQNAGYDTGILET